VPISVRRAGADVVDHVFAQLQREIARGLRQVTGFPTSSAYLRDAVTRGEMALWIVQRDSELLAAVVLSVRRSSSHTALVVELAAGRELDLWVDEIEQLLRDYRDLVGAASIEALCRGGLARRLSKRWRRKAVLMELR